MDMQHMLIANRIKSEPSVKRFVKGTRTLTAIACFEQLERMEAKCIINWKVTHIFRISLLDMNQLKALM